MTIREFNAQIGELVIDNTTENFTYYKVNPLGSAVDVKLTTRINNITIENTSNRFDIKVNGGANGKVKARGIVKYKLNHIGNWESEVIVKGESIQYVSYTNTATYNDAQLTVNADTNNYDILIFRNLGTRTDHEINLDTRPTFQNQTFIINNLATTVARKCRLNLGIDIGIVKGATINSNTATSASTTAGGTNHTHALADGGSFVSYHAISNTADRYIELDNAMSITLRGVKKPGVNVETSFYWVIDNNLANLKPTAG